MGVAFRVSLLSCVQVEQKVISQLFLVIPKAVIFNLILTLMTDRVLTIPVVLLNPANMSIAIRISLLLCIHAKINVMHLFGLFHHCHFLFFDFVQCLRISIHLFVLLLQAL